MTFTDLELAGLGSMIVQQELLEYPTVGQKVRVYGHEFKVVALQYTDQITIILEYGDVHYLMNGWSNDSPSSWEEYGYRDCHWDGRLIPAEKKEVTTYVWQPLGASEFSPGYNSWGDASW